MAVYVWGTGCGAAELFDRGMDREVVAAFIESVPDKEEFLGKPVLSPDKLDVAGCELIIVSTRHVKDITELCTSLGIAEDRLFFTKNSFELLDKNKKSRAEELLGADIFNKLLPRQKIISEPESLKGTVPEGGDYVRLASLELICRRLAAVEGAAAELGVFRGDFAKEINRLLPHRKLYLFDSFQGFDEKSGANEAFQAAHENTCGERVLSRMPNPENVEIRAGFFPASLNGLEERFCFVSLDVDFYDATLEGLRYFWPRMNSGGYLMLHDWGSPRLPGVAEALSDYEKEIGQNVPAMPLCDIGSSIVLMKN